MPPLTDPIELAGRRAPSRVVFGPHETNLGDGRALSRRHQDYYAARAAGGAGIVVTETASVHADDWPYERAPLAADCGPGWAGIALACHAHGALLLAGLGHSGNQGSSAWSQAAMWAPSAVADVVSRELPAVMEQPEIDAVVAGFAAAASSAAAAGADGVEVDAGAGALLRQFHSGLTNQRADAYGSDRLLLTRQVLAAVRAAIGPDRILALRLSCDELAPWAGVTPEQAAGHVEGLAELLDLLVVVRGGPFSAGAYRPDGHTPAQFNTELSRAMRAAAAGRVPVVLQGSVVDPDAAQAAIDDAAADLVEMTRAQIADPDLVVKVRAGRVARIRPCVLCNQACRVRDARNPVVSCIGDPAAGHESGEPGDGPDPVRREVMVVGGGPAGLECARVLAARGHTVTLAERAGRLGGCVPAAAVPSGLRRLRLLTDWLAAECAELGVRVRLGAGVAATDLDAAVAAGCEVVLATGSRHGTGERGWRAVEGAVPVLDALDVLSGAAGVPDGVLAVFDPVGGPTGVAVAEWLAEAGRAVHLVSQDPVAGTLLARTGDLADANTRLQRAGVVRELRSLVRELRRDGLLLEDVWTGRQREIGCTAVVDCGHRLPEESLYLARPGTARAGDCVAPRGILEAVLEGRRTARKVAAGYGTAARQAPEFVRRP